MIPARTVSRWLIAAVAASALALGGCDDPPADEPASVESPPEVAAPTADELPVAEDFAAEAAAEITDDNYQAELEAIEADLE